jgi:predicted glutamine amidotransferase
MCGIFGLINYSETFLSQFQAKMMHKAVSGLLTESEVRGHDAAGLAVLTDKRLSLFKNNLEASRLVMTSKYSAIVKEMNRTDRFKAMIGHTRLKTKGHQRFNINNHPILANRIVGVHNGYIHNDDILFRKYDGDIERKGEVDSEIIFRLIDLHRRNDKTLVESVQATCDEIDGSYACAFLDAEAPDYVTLFTNSHYKNINLYIYDSVKAAAFASTEVILDRALRSNMLLNSGRITSKIPLMYMGIRLNIKTGKIFKFDICQKKATGEHPMLSAVRRAFLSTRPQGSCLLEEAGYPSIAMCGGEQCYSCPYHRHGGAWKNVQN